MGCKETTVHHSPFPYQCSLIKLIIVIVYCLHYPGYFTLMGSTIFKVFFFFSSFLTYNLHSSAEHGSEFALHGVDCY